MGPSRKPSLLRPIHAAGIDRAAVAGDHGSLKISLSERQSMDRVSKPGSPRYPTRLQSSDRAATLLTAIAEALEGYTGVTVVDGRRLEKELAVVGRDGYRVCVGEPEEGLGGVCAALRPGLCRRPVQAADEIEVLLR
jgi:hypothetical protein